MLDDTFNSLYSSEKDDSVLKITAFLKAGEVNYLSFVTCSDFEIVPTFIRAFFERSFDRAGYSNVIAPVLT